jgi:uncharacterized protein YjiS (DUF1127 family)
MRVLRLRDAATVQTGYPARTSRSSSGFTRSQLFGARGSPEPKRNSYAENVAAPLKLARAAYRRKLAPFGGFDTAALWPPSLNVAAVVEWWRRTRGRREMMTLDEHQLKDLGLSRMDVAREAGKPFWRE